MIRLSDYIKRYDQTFNGLGDKKPWYPVKNIQQIILDKIKTLDNDYFISNDTAIHKTAIVDSHATLKGPIIISAHCFIGLHAYLRGGIFLDEYVSIGPGCEVKSSLIFSYSAFGHFNFVGDSLVGSHVNMEAGAVVANHYNERKDKSINAFLRGERIPTGLEKFGALIADGCKIGANAVLSPGTILEPLTIVNRLQLIDQSRD